MGQVRDHAVFARCCYRDRHDSVPFTKCLVGKVSELYPQTGIGTEVFNCVPAITRSGPYLGNEH